MTGQATKNFERSVSNVGPPSSRTNRAANLSEFFVHDEPSHEEHHLSPPPKKHKVYIAALHPWKVVFWLI